MATLSCFVCIHARSFSYCVQALVHQATTLMVSNDAGGRDTTNLFSGISLCVIGRSGTGKTALMAKLASIARAANDQRPVIIRFCGTSKGSVNGLALVQSLCHQIQLVLQLPPQPVSNNYDEAVLMRVCVCGRRPRVQRL